MSIFRRDAATDAAQSSAQPPRREPRQAAKPMAGVEKATVIASGTHIQGEIRGRADLTIEGQVEGKVILEMDVTVSEGGRVTGTIEARSVRIGGKVVGDIKGVEMVELTHSGSLEGNVSAARVIIAEGAFFKGRVEMTGKRSAAS